MAIFRAVIPAAGHGTRMRAIAGDRPKELLPVGGRPALLHTLEEALAAGLDEIAIVVSPAKAALRAWVDERAEAGEIAARITWVEQTVQRGLGDAMTRCRDFVAGKPFALLLPDNVFLSPDYSLRPMVDLAVEHGRDVVGVVELGDDSSEKFGNCGLIDFHVLGPGVLEIERLADKLPGRLRIPPGEIVTRTCGRYICRPDVLDVLEELRPATKGELDEVPAYQRIIHDRGALGCVLPPPLFDTGNPAGYAAANAYLAPDSARR